MSQKVIVLNADLSFHSVITLEKAIKSILKGVAEVLSYDMTKPPLKSFGNFVLHIPKIIKLTKFIRKLYQKGIFPSKKNILVRDKYICAYCGEKGTEVDHVIPKSHGKEFSGITWENCVCSCSKCNREKANRTPSQAKMFLKYGKPYEPTIMEFAQSKMEVMGIKQAILDFWQESQHF